MVEGHTDDVLNPQSNLSLSENRSEPVSGFLKQNLSASSAIITKRHGVSQPVVPNMNDENRQRKRRLEILVMPK